MSCVPDSVLTAQLTFELHFHDFLILVIYSQKLQPVIAKSERKGLSRSELSSIVFTT